MKFSWARALIVARREYLTAVRRKAFLFTLIAVPLYFGGVVTLATRGEISGRRDSMRSFTRLGVVDSSGVYANASHLIVTPVAIDPVHDPDRLETYRTEVRFYADQASLEGALRSGELAQGLVIPADYLTSGRLRRYARSSGIFSSLSGSPISRWLVKNLLAGRVDSARVERAARPYVDMDLYALNKEGRFELRGDRREMTEFMLPFMFAILLAACIMTGGQYLLQGVSEEKESRILESLLCTLSAEDLLLGKLLGLGAVGMTLVAVWMGAGLVLGSPMMAMAQIHLPPALFVFAVVYFLLGYLFYASLMIGIGAVTNNMREAQQFAMMFSFANFLPIIVLTNLLAHPDGPLAVTLSLFPPTAATAMMLRMALPSADVPPWQIAASVVLLAAAGWIVLRGAARVFRIGLLMYGKTPSLPEILRWARTDR
jgi:ABC-2 type transport system permease protein